MTPDNYREQLEKAFKSIKVEQIDSQPQALRESGELTLYILRRGAYFILNDIMEPRLEKLVEGIEKRMKTREDARRKKR